MHPTEPEWMLASRLTDGCKRTDRQECNMEVYLTQDLGKTWKLLQRYVAQFEWAPSADGVLKPGMSKQSIFMVTYDMKSGNQPFGVWSAKAQFSRSDDLWKTKYMLLPRGNRFLFLDKFIFVAVVNKHHETQVNLYVSSEGGRIFKKARLPFQLTEHSYTILDTSEGAPAPATSPPDRAARSRDALACSTAGARVHAPSSTTGGSARAADRHQRTATSGGCAQAANGMRAMPRLRSAAPRRTPCSPAGVHARRGDAADRPELACVRRRLRLPARQPRRLQHRLRQHLPLRCGGAAVRSLAAQQQARRAGAVRLRKGARHRGNLHHQRAGAPGRRWTLTRARGPGAHTPPCRLHPSRAPGCRRWRTLAAQINSEAAQLKEKPKLRTKITFDKGGKWSNLRAPLTTNTGKEFACNPAEDPKCSLHLHGVTDSWGPFYSSKNAIGLVMATGNVGYHLSDKEDEVHTFFSRDGGLSWTMARVGSHIYEYGDHGAIIVIADDRKASNEVFYSWDEALTWNELRFSETPTEVENIVIEPQATSQVFVMYGTRGEQVRCGAGTGRGTPSPARGGAGRAGAEAHAHAVARARACTCTGGALPDGLFQSARAAVQGRRPGWRALV